jgi:hypothetical protein
MGVYEVGEARGAMMLFLKKSEPQCPETLPVFDFLEWKPEIGASMTLRRLNVYAT